MIADDIGRKVSVVFIGYEPVTPPMDEAWILLDKDFIVRSKGDIIVGMWNVQQITGWKYLDEENVLDEV